MDKLDLIDFYGIQDGDFIVDTGFYGSILDDISTFIDFKGFLLSSSANRYEYLHGGSFGSYRDWILQIENIRRSRSVETKEGRLPMETYKQNSDFYFEQGFFQGFRKGAEKIMSA
jgi:hypothetical protein